MTDARSEILGKIGTEHTSKWSVEALIPALVQRPQKDLIALFVQKVQRAKGSIETVSSIADVPKEIAQHIVVADGLSEIVVSDALGNLPWREAGLVPVGLDLGIDGITSVTDCFAGVAETGTLVSLSDETRDSRLNFVSRHHIVVLHADAIVGPYEDVWGRMKARHMMVPRAVNFITGPSRTADIEQTIELGAHGPADVHIVLINSQEG